MANGIDTVSYAFRGFDLREAQDAFNGPRRDSISGRTINPVGRGRTTTLTIAEERTKLGLTVTPSGDALVWCEGSLGNVMGQGRVLVRGDQLAAGEVAARAVGRRLGFPLDGYSATVRRCDLASDVAFVDRREGFAFLRGVRSLVLPRHQVRVIGARGSNAVQTVAWENRSGIQLRIYDKTAQRGEHGGSVVRIERQIRPPFREQASPADLARRDLSDDFGSLLRRWTLDGLVVVAPQGAYWVLKARIGQPLPGHRTLTPRSRNECTGRSSSSSPRAMLPSTTRGRLVSAVPNFVQLGSK